MANLNELLEQGIVEGRISPDQATSLMRQAGFTGQFGGGRAEAFFDANADANALGLDMLNFGDAGTYDNAGYTPYEDDLLQGAEVMPLGVEPLHEYERAALQQVGENPFGLSQQGTSPLAELFLERSQPYMDEAADFYRVSGRGLTGDKIDAAMNPYQQQVVDRSVLRLNEEAEKIRAELLRRQGGRGSASFGDLRFSQQMGDIDQELLNKTGDMVSGLNYEGYNSTVNRLLNERGLQSRAGQGISGLGSSLGSLAGTAQNISTSGQNAALQALAAQQNAGQNIRGFNQGLADIALSEYMANQNYPRTNLNNTLGMLPAFQSGTGQQVVRSDSGSQRLGNTLTTIGGVLSQPNISQGLSNFSFGDPFDVVPNSGGYGAQQPNALGRLFT